MKDTSDSTANSFNISQFRVYPAWAVVGIAVSALAAIALLPEGPPFEESSLRASSLALALGLLFGPIVAGFKSPASLLRSECILSVGLIYWILLDPIQAAYRIPAASYLAAQKAFIGVALFGAGIWIGAYLSRTSARPISDSTAGTLAPAAVFGIGLISFVSGIFKPALACEFYPPCFAQAFFTPWDEVPWRTISVAASGGGWNTLLKYVGFLGFLTLPLSAVLYRIEGRVSWRVALLGLLGTLLLVMLVQSGARRMVGMVAAATALVLILLQSRVGIRDLVKLSALFGMLLLLLEAMVSWRTIGIGTGLFSDEHELTGKHQGVLSVDKNFHYLTASMTVVPAEHPYKPVDGLLSLFGAPIPRSVWPSKPKERGIDLLPYIGERRGPGFSWTSSAVGDFYVMGGMWVVTLGGIVFGLLGGACNRYLFQPPSANSRLLYAFGVMVLVVGLRATRDVVAIGFFILVGAQCLFMARRLLISLTRPSTRLAK